MICPTCGINSSTEDVCSFCKHPIPKPGTAPPQQTLPPLPSMTANYQTRTTLTGEVLDVPPPPSSAQPTMAMPPSPAPGYRTTLTGEVIEVAPPPPQQTVAMPTMGMPPQRPGTTSSPASGQVGPYGLPASAYTPQFVKQSLEAESERSTGERWELFLAIGCPLLALSMAIVHFAPNLLIWVAIADLFFLSMAMSGTSAIPSYDDSYAECGIALGLCFLFGPLVAGVALLISGLVRQEGNNAVLSLLSLILFLQMIFRYVLLGSNPSIGAALMFVGMFQAFSIIPVVIAFAGWLFGNFFRPVNEA